MILQREEAGGLDEIALLRDLGWGEELGMFDDEDAEFVVVINDEEQYSIWPVGKKIPQGWREAGATGKKRDCLAFIDANWIDMRPLSLRKQLGEV